MDGPRVISVLIADDHPVVRSGLKALINSIDEFEVVADVSDGASAVREAQLLRPDVVMMDVQMPGVNGLEATRRIRESLPDVAVLMLTMFDDDDTVFAAMRAGAQGYLLKGAEQDEIHRALRSVVAGEAIFGPGIASRVLGYFSTPRPDAPVAFPELTPRELEVLDRVAAGQRNGTIATELFLSPKTVSNHMSAIFAKLSVADRAEAIIRARESGLGRGTS